MLIRYSCLILLAFATLTYAEEFNVKIEVRQETSVQGVRFLLVKIVDADGIDSATITKNIGDAVVIDPECTDESRTAMSSTELQENEQLANFFPITVEVTDCQNENNGPQKTVHEFNTVGFLDKFIVRADEENRRFEIPITVPKDPDDFDSEVTKAEGVEGGVDGVEVSDPEPAIDLTNPGERASRATVSGAVAEEAEEARITLIVDPPDEVFEFEILVIVPAKIPTLLTWAMTVTVLLLILSTTILLRKEERLRKA